jgi:GH43 family beta-xylosidase
MREKDAHIPQSASGLRTVLALWCCFLVVDMLPGSARAELAGRMFTNPVVRSGQDPWVNYWKGNYYFCQSETNVVWISKSQFLEKIGRAPRKIVWQPPRNTSYSEELWAPELHFLNERWYIYVAADDGDNIDHRMYVLQGGATPEAPFALKGKIATPDNLWAIDGTVLQMPDGRLFFLWSGHETQNSHTQNLYIAPMRDPWTISGERVCISRPHYDWETNGLPINEGPEVLWHGHQLFVIYSASGAWGDDYCLGQLAWKGGDVLNPESWEKSPMPIFSGTQDIIGPGHCSFAKSPDGREDWIVYHAHQYKGSGWKRDVRIQPFTWNSDGSPHFGSPVSVETPLPIPSGE